MREINSLIVEFGVLFPLWREFDDGHLQTPYGAFVAHCKVHKLKRINYFIIYAANFQTSLTYF